MSYVLKEPWLTYYRCNNEMRKGDVDEAVVSCYGYSIPGGDWRYGYKIRLVTVNEWLSTSRPCSYYYECFTSSILFFALCFTMYVFFLLRVPPDTNPLSCYIFCCNYTKFKPWKTETWDKWVRARTPDLFVWMTPCDVIIIAQWIVCRLQTW